MNMIYRIHYDDKAYVHELASHTSERFSDGSLRDLYMRFLDCRANLRVEITALKDPDFAVTKYTAIFYNDTDKPVRLYQFDTGISIQIGRAHV